MTSNAQKKSSPTAVKGLPYLSFKTLQSGIQSIRSNDALPAKIDQSVWPSKSGADRNALMTAFRFLGLIDSDNDVQPVFEKLVAAQAGSTEEKSILGDILKEKYSELFDLNLQKVTPAQFNAATGKYGQSGSTVERVRRFFISAVLHCDIPISPLLTSRKPRRKVPGSATNGADSSRQARSKPTRTPTTKKAASEPTPDGMHKKIELPESGGTLMVIGAFNPFDLSQEERKLVYGISDMMAVFEQKAAQNSEG